MNDLIHTHAHAHTHTRLIVHATITCSLLLQIHVVTQCRHLMILTTVIFTLYNSDCYCMPNTYLVLFILLYLFSNYFVFAHPMPTLFSISPYDHA